VISVREELSIGPDLLTNDDVQTEIKKAIYHGSDATSSTPVHATFRDGTVTLMGAVATPKDKEDMVSRLRDRYGIGEQWNRDAIEGKATPVSGGGLLWSRNKWRVHRS
jgi:hypothetical protein